jgi:trk system potassium uptake protein TrkH
MEVGFFEHVFRATSLISSSGYELKSVDLALFTDSMILVAIVMALIGGTMGSPAGGMKLNRVSVAIRMLRMELKKAVVPNQAVLSINYNGKLIDKDFMMRTMAMIFIWVITAVSGVMILSFTADMTLTEASVMGIGALGNLGMTTMSVAELASMETAGKLVLIMLMMVGRVEIVPFIILLKSRLQVKTGGTL